MKKAASGFKFAPLEIIHLETDAFYVVPAKLDFWGENVE